jgi:hypothetical protein
VTSASGISSSQATKAASTATPTGHRPGLRGEVWALTEAARQHGRQLAEVRRLLQADADANADPSKTEASLLALCDRKGKRLATLSIWDLEDTERVPGRPGSLRLVSPRLDMADAAGTTKVSLKCLGE